ncbi:MAG: hypothetical protein ACT4OM_08485 [Actinomycetota bacterium]
MKSIEAILEAYEKQQQIARREMERRKVEREGFLAEFAGKVAIVIRPVMEQTGALMERSGHEFQIVEQQEGERPGHRRTNAAIKLTIFPNGERPRDTQQIGWPHVAFIVSSNRNTVMAHESAMMPGTGGPFGTAGEYSIGQIDEQVVQQHILNVLAQAMGVGGRRERLPRRARRARSADPAPAPAKRPAVEEVPRTATGEERIDAAFRYLAAPLDDRP